MIPISKFKSNHLSKRRELTISSPAEELKIDDDFMGQMSPSATHAMRDMNFKNIDHPSLLKAAGLQKFDLNSSGPASPKMGS